MGPSPKDLTGMVFGRLTVINRSNKTTGSPYFWNCLCNCGNYNEVRSDRLINGQTTSCGCFRSESSSERVSILNTTHGLSNDDLYRTWQGMMSRCYNQNNEKYKDYGGRGITVCERWHDVRNFIEDIISKPENVTIDRKNVNGNYEPNNVQWASDKEQQNNKRNNVMVFFEGQKMTVTQAAEKSGIPRTTIFNRINSGKSDEELFKKK